MPHAINWNDAAKLEVNARSHRYDAALEPIADAIDRGDTEAWQRVPAERLGRAELYATFRRYYREAVDAGLVVDDRSGPSAA